MSWKIILSPVEMIHVNLSNGMYQLQKFSDLSTVNNVKKVLMAAE